MIPCKSLIVVCTLCSVIGHAQIINIKKTAENAAVSQTNQTINNDINNGVNAVFQAPGKIFRKVKSNTRQSQDQTVTNSPVSTSDNVSTPPVKTIYVTDFTPGKIVLLSDDFTTTRVGDFPENWLTNSSGEVRKVSDEAGSWLQLSADGIFTPQEMHDLPENFTLEYDAIFHPDAGENVHYIFYIYSVKDKIVDFKETNFPGNAGIYFAFNTNAGEIDAENFELGKAGIIDLHMATDLVKSSLANKVHIAIARQRAKLSLYVNGNRVFSSPSALPTSYTYNAIKFGSFYMAADDFVLISNLKIASN